MRAQNKIAVGVGVVLIVLGIIYFRSNDKAATEPLADSSQLQDDLSKSAAVENTTPPAEAAPAPVAKVASPAPRQVETIKFAPSNETPRPKPSVTDTPTPTLPATVAAPSKERAGLSSIPPVLPSEEESSPADIETPIKPAEIKAVDIKPVTNEPTVSDVPPNVVAKETKLATPAASHVEPVAPKAERVPTAPPIGVAATPPVTKRIHVIQKGDTYTSLAVKYLGHAKYAKLIEKANPGREAGRLYIGSKINIPDAPAPTLSPTGAANVKPIENVTTAKKADVAAKNRKTKEVIPPPDPSRAYVVQPGESWQSIAHKFLGKTECDAELYELNKERVGGDPNLLRSGLVIELPARAKMPTKAPVAAPKPATPKTTASSKNTI